MIPILLNSTVLALVGLTPATEARRASAQAELGKALFFDTRLSFNDGLSCATCHQPDKGFADGQRFSKGATGNTLNRHTPHLYNLAGASSFFWDGRAATLEEQVLMPIQNPDEMNLPLESLRRKLESVPYYAKAFDDLYPEDGLTADNIARAIACFERTLVSRDAPFDRREAGDSSALGESALRGAELFFGRARCSRCHKGSNFTDGQFHNTGVPGEDPGRAVWDRVGSFRMRPYPFFQTQRAFKTPGLRNVARSAPYFHDGSEPTLGDVVRFYNQGGKDRESYGLSADIAPLGLDEGAIDDLVAFLESLTGPVEIEPPAVPDSLSVYLPLDKEN
ncbi:MAG: cytochrome-c peroxidase [Vicinamibacteria bacterium]